MAECEYSRQTVNGYRTNDLKCDKIYNPLNSRLGGLDLVHCIPKIKNTK